MILFKKNYLLQFFLLLLLSIPTSASVPCSEREEINGICSYGGNACCEGEFVRIPGGEIIDCLDAIELFETEESVEYTDEQCGMIRFFVEMALDKSGCPCGSTNTVVEEEVDPTPAPVRCKFSNMLMF